MGKSIVFTQNAPDPIGPYSQATEINGMLFVSGQIAIDPISGEMKTDELEAETRQVLTNLKAILDEAGYDLNEVLKCSIFLSSMDHFAVVNKVYAEFFDAGQPARETVAVSGLPKGVNVEISCIASH